MRFQQGPCVVLIQRYAKHHDAGHSCDEAEQLRGERIGFFHDGRVGHGRTRGPEGVFPRDLGELREVAAANVKDRLRECGCDERADAVVTEYDDRPIDALHRLCADAVERAVGHLEQVAHQGRVARNDRDELTTRHLFVIHRAQKLWQQTWTSRGVAVFSGGVVKDVGGCGDDFGVDRGPGLSNRGGTQRELVQCSENLHGCERLDFGERGVAGAGFGCWGEGRGRLAGRFGLCVSCRFGLGLGARL